MISVRYTTSKPPIRRRARWLRAPARKYTAPWKEGLTDDGVLTWSNVVKYIWNKGGIAGDRFKLPFMGPFLESVNTAQGS